MDQQTDPGEHDGTGETNPPAPGDVESAPTTTQPSAATRAVERDDARVASGADRPPTAEEERDAPASVSDEQRAHAREMLARGASQEGEGRIG